MVFFHRAVQALQSPPASVSDSTSEEHSNTNFSSSSSDSSTPVNSPSIASHLSGQSPQVMPVCNLPGFVPLPSNPADMTTEQLNVLFPPENQQLFVRELVRLFRKQTAG